MRGCLAVLAGFLLLTSFAAFAQSTATVITGTVTTKEDGQPYPGSTVSIPALGVSATTGRDGKYTLNVPQSAAKGRTVELRVSAPGLAAKSVKVTLTPGTISQDFAMALGVSAQVTVGSRAAGADVEKAVPVDVITQDKIEAASPSGEMAQIIEKLAPSFNFPRTTISDGTDTVRPATIRALGPDQLLVLLNGKRRHNSALVNVNGTIGRGSAAVDLNALPAAALDRVEVLRDGAAAQYGSDAIAGVLNLVLKSGPSPLDVSITAGETTRSDGGLLDVNLNDGFALGRGSLNVTAEFRRRNATNRAGDDPRPQGSRDPIQQPDTRYGDGATTDAIGFLNGVFPISDDGATSAYVFGGGSYRYADTAGNFRRALQAQNWPQIYPNGFLPKITPTVVDYSATAGVRGAVGKFLWDASLQYGHNRFDFEVRDSLNTSLGPTSTQTVFDAGSLAFGQLVGNLDVSRELSVGLAGPLNIAFGAEYRRENYQQIAGEPNSYIDGGVPDQFGNKAPPGAQVFPGFRPSNEVDISRNSIGVYADAEANVTNAFRLGLAGRFEHYSDFGNSTDVKVTGRYEVSPAFALRAAGSTGFRAPSLGQSYFSTVSTNFLNVNGVFQPFDILTARVDSPVARALGARDLEPEKSVNFSGGVVVSPGSQFDLTADYFNIAIRDRIIFSGNFTGTALNPILQPFGASGVRFFTNAINTRTDGVELTANYHSDLGSNGILRLQAAWAHAETSVTNIAPTPPQLAAFQTVLFDRLEVRRLECGQPKDNVRLTSDWSKGPVGVVLSGGRYGSYCGIANGTNEAPFGPGTSADQTFGGTWLVDAEVSYTMDVLRVAFGAQNLFDTTPDLTLFVNSNSGINRFPNNSPYGYNGRFVYTRLSYRF
ncbi:MAG: TonB-dependent receptor domain-containing protein [Acidobacteriota bacterium]